MARPRLVVFVARALLKPILHEAADQFILLCDDLHVVSLLVKLSRRGVGDIRAGGGGVSSRSGQFKSCCRHSQHDIFPNSPRQALFQPFPAWLEVVWIEGSDGIMKPASTLQYSLAVGVEERDKLLDLSPDWRTLLGSLIRDHYKFGMDYNI